MWFYKVKSNLDHENQSIEILSHSIPSIDLNLTSFTLPGLNLVMTNPRHRHHTGSGSDPHLCSSQGRCKDRIDNHPSQVLREPPLLKRPSSVSHRQSSQDFLITRLINHSKRLMDDGCPELQISVNLQDWFLIINLQDQEPSTVLGLDL